MIKLRFKSGELSRDEQRIIHSGFVRHTDEFSVPQFEKNRINWLSYDREKILVGALTADVLWDWIYIDELWVSESHRGEGMGKSLMNEAEIYASSHNLVGLWLWTQSWQAADFYKHMGYEEFARFPDFPKGHFRIGFRKQFSTGKK